jgi:hypothetical protein
MDVCWSFTSSFRLGRVLKELSIQLIQKYAFPPSRAPTQMTHVNVLNLHKIDLARKYYTHLQREIKKEEAREKEWKNSH